MSLKAQMVYLTAFPRSRHCHNVLFCGLVGLELLNRTMENGTTVYADSDDADQPALPQAAQSPACPLQHGEIEIIA